MLDRFIVPPGKKIVLSRDYDSTYQALRAKVKSQRSIPQGDNEVKSN
jgi:hypothetical protein